MKLGKMRDRLVILRDMQEQRPIPYWAQTIKQYKYFYKKNCKQTKSMIKKY